MSMHTYAHLCIPMHTYAYLCIPMHTYAYLCMQYLDLFNMLRYVAGYGPPSGAPHFRGSPKAESGCCIRGADVMYFYWLVAATFFHIVCIYH